jgi:hypothetical protein|tara:strand:+ start:1369 stop:2388 length:1020 start_codon:yes stop_codon:yes gene_type:complete
MSFKAFEQDDFVVSADSITAGLWTGNSPELTAFYTSSTQVASSNGAYYINVYNSESYEDIQFAIAYGDVDGSGSLEFDSAVAGKSPSSTNYGQYRTLVLGDENAEFSFGGVTAPNFYAISIDRNRYKEGLFPGSTTLDLTVGGNTISLTDNSQVVTSVEFNDAGRVFQLVSGSAGTVVDTTSTGGGTNGYSASGSYGLFLPDIATYLLNPSALDAAASDGGIVLGTTRGDNVDSANAGRLYDAIVDGASFTANSEETITSDFIFVRPRSSEFNYSENPSFISGSTGEVLYSSFINNPTTFITTVGLYNDSSELLAVAKLSTPLPKDFTKEALVRVKLDF